MYEKLSHARPVTSRHAPPVTTSPLVTSQCVRHCRHTETIAQPFRGTLGAVSHPSSPFLLRIVEVRSAGREAPPRQRWDEWMEKWKQAYSKKAQTVSAHSLIR